MRADRILYHPVVRTIVKEARSKKIPLYLVGGAVRMRLQSPSEELSNIDFLVTGDVRFFTTMLADRLRSRAVLINPKFDTVLIPVRKIEYEFSSPRNISAEFANFNGLSDNELLRDLSLRDFTINALAIQLSPAQGKILDPFGGINDLRNRVIRTPIDPEITIKEDPLRMLRAARIAAQLNFAIDRELLEAMHDQRELITRVSVERRTTELLKILNTQKPSIGLKLLYITGLLDSAFPEIAQIAKLRQNRKPRHKDIFEHTLKVVDAVAENGGVIETRIAALLHDIGKPSTRRFEPKLGWTFHGHEVVGERIVEGLGKSWKLPSATAEKVAKLVRLHMRPINLSDEGVTDSAVRRLGTQAGEDIDELIKLCRADVTSSDPKRVKHYLQNFEKVVEHLQEVVQKDQLRAFQSPVRGEVIMKEAGIGPCPLVGKLKKAIEEAILDGIIPNEYEAALQYLRKVKDAIIAEAEIENS